MKKENKIKREKEEKEKRLLSMRASQPKLVMRQRLFNDSNMDELH